MTTVIKITNLRCVVAADGPTDDVKLQFNHQQVWPNHDDGFFSISQGTSVDLFLSFTYEGDCSIDLFGDKNIGHDNRLGGAIIGQGDTDGLDSITTDGENGSHYTITYKTKSIDDF